MLINHMWSIWGHGRSQLIMTSTTSQVMCLGKRFVGREMEWDSLKREERNSHRYYLERKNYKLSCQIASGCDRLRDMGLLMRESLIISSIYFMILWHYTWYKSVLWVNGKSDVDWASLLRIMLGTIWIA